MTEVKDADIASSAWHMDLIVARSAQKGSAFGICSNIRTKQGLNHSQQEGADEVIAWDDRPVFETCQSVSAEHLCSAGECWREEMVCKSPFGFNLRIGRFNSKWEQKLKLLPEKSRLASFAWPLHHMRLAVLQIWLDWKREELMCLPPNSFKL